MSGSLRNLAGDLPRRGFLHAYYLNNGAFLMLGPARDLGPIDRLRVALFVLDKDLRRGLQPLDICHLKLKPNGKHERLVLGQRRARPAR